MSKIYQRLRGFFTSSQPSYDPYPDTYNGERSDSPRNSPSPRDENQNGINDDDENVRNNNSLRPTTRQGQARARTPVDQRPPSTPINLPNSQFRPVPNNIQPNLPSNNNNNNINTNIIPTVNTDTATVSNPSAPAGLPSQGPSSHPPVNPIPQTSLPSINQLSQVPLHDRFPSLINRNRIPFRISPNSTLVGFPPNQNRQSSWLNRSTFPSQQNRPSFPTRLFPPPRPQTHISNIQVDYPIENVIIDENIPSSIAMKINEAVEHDRFGNTYYTQHYAYEPKTQHIAIGNNQQIERRLNGNSHHTGRRYIREMTNEKYYPQLQNQNSNNIQLIIDPTPQVNYICQYNDNSFPVPINHYIACASPNDPMRCY